MEIQKAFRWTARHRRPYLQAIETRTSGSHWGQTIPWEELASLPWHPLNNPVEGLHVTGCQYFFLERVDVQRLLPESRQKFRLLSSFGEHEIDSVQLREGSHGVELVSNLVTQEAPKIAWLILGQARYENKEKADGELMVWSAFPGELTTSIKHIPQFSGTVESLRRQLLPVAVKGI